jgi:hyperosmotically inducible periplasmic protein
MKMSLSKRIFSIGMVLFSLTMLVSCGVKDETIQTSVAALPELSGVTATVKDGVVTLTGAVKDDASKAAAETAVKNVKGVKSVQNEITVAPPPPQPEPVVIAADDPLTKGVTDATKDFPGVTASVKDGVITLTGEIKRSNLQKLMMSLNTLKPKKIENQLTIK